MDKNIKIITLITCALFFSLYLPGLVNADWWVRPSISPTRPVITREELPPEPTVTTQPTTQPTAIPTGSLQPTATPRIGSPTETPSNGSNNSSNNSSGTDQCASGQSYTGPYCGWSPEKDKQNSDSSSDGVSSPRIGGPDGPDVLGLSATTGNDLTTSDIILLSGVLCLLLYARSKLSVTINRK